MKVLYIIFVTASLSTTNARLLEKNTEKPAETEPTESSVAVRVSRQAFYEDDFGTSKEDNTQGEDLRPYVRKGRYSVKSKSSNSKSTTRTKDTSDRAVITKRTEIEETPTKSSKVLIKKPIPKFNEVDYEDFQGKINRSPAKVADSGEHEDEDFNLDDYEFDVNHDEFVGRGKPLEPRAKINEAKTTKVKKSYKPGPTLPPPEIKMQSKVVIPTEPLVNPRKSITKKAADKMKEDYYDDVITTTKASEIETKRELDDDFSEDSDDSKESNRKNPTRVVRSPWFVKFLGDRMGKKTATVMSKVLDMLPIFPQAHSAYHERKSITQDAMTDPLTGYRFMY